MDYEKKYKEALERAKNYHDSNFSFGTTELTEAIFPELRESEDERIVNWLYDMLKHGIENAPKGCPDNPIAEKALAWLENQKEQKPVEWSEEDELMRSACIAFIKDEKFKGYERSYECIDWLKSLRPQNHWKPNEEQMEALRNAFHKLSNTDVADSVRLSIMYDNLKKL